MDGRHKIWVMGTAPSNDCVAKSWSLHVSFSDADHERVAEHIEHDQKECSRKFNVSATNRKKLLLQILTDKQDYDTCGSEPRRKRVDQPFGDFLFIKHMCPRLLRVIDNDHLLLRRVKNIE